MVTKDKNCIKYFVVSGMILLCLYSNVIAKIFESVFDNIYYGNLTNMFTALISALIWGLEIWGLVVISRKISIQIFTKKENKGKELELWRVIILFVITVLPMLIISACLSWKLKIVYALGERVTIIGLLCNVSEILAYAVRMVLMIMLISCVQQGFEILFKTKYAIPYGAIFALLTFGLIDFFVLAVDLRVFYLIVSFLYGVIYLLSNKKFSITWILCYLIYLL
ncbi:MAG: hypothetical protein IJA72_02170 [Clostridia bacterium]|nr:hypothetical protein [Clostridia bacterium]